MERGITGYHTDSEGVWVAELSCGHNQHVRHDPPFQLRPWVVTPEGRDERLGMPLRCPRCDWTELPLTARWVRTSPTWDGASMPEGLRHTHRLAEATWALIEVEHGQLRFTAATTPPLDIVLEPGSVQPIPPEVLHEVEPAGEVRFHLQFLRVERETPDRAPAEQGEAGGDPVCWAAVVCSTCGGVLTDPGHSHPLPALGEMAGTE